MKRRLIFFALLLVAVFFSACRKDSKTETQKPGGVSVTPEWAQNSNIYEVNVRQFTPVGTFAGFRAHLPRLKSMNVGILWFMPIYPISETKRKGTLGSYYAVSDYRAVNPDFGTMEEFKALVGEIHSLGMKVILDWVPNHTGWDHAWIKDHPDYYTQNAKGEIVDPQDPKTGKSFGWTDVADLDYDNPGLRTAMTEDLLFWLKDVGVDGFRMDVAEQVPMAFWEECIPKLREARPDVFMLAEAEFPPHRNEGLFAMSYGWSFHQLMKEIAQGKKPLSAIDDWYKQDRARFKSGYHMHFTANHDENSWNGTEEESFGKAKDAMAVLAFTYDGMPLIYSGQEAGLNKRLAFFEKDTIRWGDFPRQKLFTQLLGIKILQPPLWNGAAGAEPRRLKTNDDSRVFAFVREKEDQRVIVMINMSNTAIDGSFQEEGLDGTYTELFSGMDMMIASNVAFALPPWGYVLLVKKAPVQ